MLFVYYNRLHDVVKFRLQNFDLDDKQKPIQCLRACLQSVPEYYVSLRISEREKDEESQAVATISNF